VNVHRLPSPNPRVGFKWAAWQGGEDNVERGGGKGSRERGRAEIGKEGVA